MLLLLLVILTNTNLIIAENGTMEANQTEIAPKRDRRVLIDKIARRILEEAEASASKNRSESADDSDAEIKDLELINKVIKEEAANLRRKTGDKIEKGVKPIDTKNRSTGNDKDAIDFTLNERSRKQDEKFDFNLEEDKSKNDKSEEPLIEIEEVHTEDLNKNLNQTTAAVNKQDTTTDKYSVEIEIIENKNVTPAHNTEKAIPVEVVYDDGGTYFMIQTTAKSTITNNKNATNSNNQEDLTTIDEVPINHMPGKKSEVTSSDKPNTLENNPSTAANSLETTSESSDNANNTEAHNYSNESNETTTISYDTTTTNTVPDTSASKFAPNGSEIADSDLNSNNTNSETGINNTKADVNGFSITTSVKHNTTDDSSVATDSPDSPETTTVNLETTLSASEVASDSSVITRSNPKTRKVGDNLDSFLDDLPEILRSEFIDKIARRINDEVKVEQIANTTSLEISDAELKTHSEFVDKIFKEEQENLLSEAMDVQRIDKEQINSKQKVKLTSDTKSDSREKDNKVNRHRRHYDEIENDYLKTADADHNKSTSVANKPETATSETTATYMSKVNRTNENKANNSETRSVENDNKPAETVVITARGNEYEKEHLSPLPSTSTQNVVDTIDTSVRDFNALDNTQKQSQAEVASEEIVKVVENETKVVAVTEFPTKFTSSRDIFEPNVTTTTEEIVKARTEYITDATTTEEIIKARTEYIADILEPNVTTTTEEIIKARTEYITDIFDPNVTTTTEEVVKARTEYITGKYDTDISEEGKANSIVLINGQEEIDTINHSLATSIPSDVKPVNVTVAVFESIEHTSEATNFEPSRTSTTEEIIKARTEYITGKYDTDISEENKANHIILIDGKEEIENSNYTSLDPNYIGIRFETKHRPVNATVAIFESIEHTSELPFTKNNYLVLQDVQQHTMGAIDEDKLDNTQHMGSTRRKIFETVKLSTKGLPNVDLTQTLANNIKTTKSTPSPPNFTGNGGNILQSLLSFSLINTSNNDDNSKDDSSDSNDSVDNDKDIDAVITTPLSYLTTTPVPSGIKSLPVVLYSAIKNDYSVKVNNDKRMGNEATKKKTYEVYEILPGQDPFKPVNKVPRVMFMDVKDEDLKPPSTVKPTTKITKMKEIEIKYDVPSSRQPFYAPVYNYDPKNAYFNPSYRYGPTYEPSEAKTIENLFREGPEIQDMKKINNIISQTHYAPVYNYAPKNAYYNPSNRYQPYDSSQASDSDTVEYKSNNDYDEPYLPEVRPLINKNTELRTKNQQDNVPVERFGENRELDSFFGVEETKNILREKDELKFGKNKKLDSFFGVEDTKDRAESKLSNENEGADEAVLDLKAPILQIRQVLELLHKRNHYDFKQSKPVKDQNMTSRIRHPMVKFLPLNIKNKKTWYLKDNKVETQKVDTRNEPKQNEPQHKVIKVNEKTIPLLKELLKATSQDVIRDSKQLTVLLLNDKDTKKELSDKLREIYIINKDTKRQFDDRPYPKKRKNKKETKTKLSSSFSKKRNTKKKPVARNRKAHKVHKTDGEDTDDAREDLDYEDTTPKHHLRQVTKGREYAWSSDPADLSSGDAEAMRTLNTEAIELVLNLTNTEHIYPILLKLNQMYNSNTTTGLRRELNLDNEVEPYIRVLKDKIKMGAEDRALTNYNWLATAVDIRSAIQKLVDLTERLLKGTYLHPKDLQLIKFVLYLYKSAEESIQLQNFRRSPQNWMHGLTKINKPWLVRPLDKKLLRNFGKFWTEVEALLDNFHDAIKHISLVTKFKKQRWFQNLKELYLTDNTRKEVLEVLLHLTTSNLIDLLEAANMNGLGDNYVKFAMNYSNDMLKIKSEFDFLISVYNVLKNEINE